MKDYKIIKIKIFDDEIFTTKNFKIIKEINYKQFSNSSKTKFQLISIIKNKEEKVIKKFIKEFKSDCFFNNRKFDAIIKTGIDKYLDEFINNENDYSLNIVEQGRKCDLDVLVHNKDKLVKETVARHGFDDHLDILEKENNYNINKIIDELRGKRDL